MLVVGHSQVLWQLCVQLVSIHASCSLAACKLGIAYTKLLLDVVSTGMFFQRLVGLLLAGGKS